MLAWYIFYGVGVLCAPFVYAISLAYFQRKYALISKEDYKADRNYSIFFSILSLVTGPLFFLIVYFGLSERAVYGSQMKKPINESATRGQVKNGVSKPKPTVNVKPSGPPPPPKKKG